MDGAATPVSESITDGKYSNVWIQVYAKPVTGDSDPTVSGESGAFFVDDATGMVRVWDGAWGNAAIVAKNQWVGFLVHIDYGAGAWDLYVNNGTFLANATKIAGPLTFGVSQADLERFSVQSGDAAYIDELAIGVGGETVSGASPGNVAVAAFGSNVALHEFVLPVYSAAWTGSRQLNGALGTALVSGLAKDDQLQIYGAVWDVYNVTLKTLPTPGEFIAAVGSESAATAKIFENTKILVNLHDTRDPAVTYGFFPFDTSDYTAVDAVATTHAAASVDIPLNGTGPAGTGLNLGGWTAITWNDPVNIENLPFQTHVQHGDQCWIASPGNPNFFLEYWYSTEDGNVWMRNAGDATGTSVPAAAKLWLKRQAAIAATATYTRL
ncbi:MAG: hypothetical protein OSB41_14270 [Kiritimatiellae bacterium]|nr:hypothetical protein [Kiritimatiellia bacterium]